MNYHATCLKIDWLMSNSIMVQINYNPHVNVQGDQKFSVPMMITVQKTRKNISNIFSHLP
jgi:hypothetical protein